MSTESIRPGRYRMICDISGFVGWNDEMAKRWDGSYVLRRFLGAESQRHPQELVRGMKDDQSVPNPRPEGTDVFLAYNDVTPSSL